MPVAGLEMANGDYRITNEDRRPIVGGQSLGMTRRRLVARRRCPGAAALMAILPAVVGLLGCTAAGRLDSARPAPEFTQGPRALRVLHVGAEVAWGAGYAISPEFVISSAHEFREQSRAATVEGTPMMVGNFLNRAHLDREGLAHREDWVVLCGPEGQFTPNVIDPAYRPKPGERVILGGFFLVDKEYTQDEYLRVPPDFVQGVVVDGPTGRDELAGLVFVKVPATPYNGFSGGPAACVGEDGQLRVWGTIVWQGYVHSGWFAPYALGIAPLPADVLTRRIWKSY